MDEQLGAAYERLDGALAPPADAVSLVADRVAVRRQRRTVGMVVGSVLAGAVVAGATWTVLDREPSTGPDSARVATDPATPAATTEPPEEPSATAGQPTVSASLDVDCDGAEWRVGRVVNPEAHPAGSRDPEGVARGWQEVGRSLDMRQIDDDNAVADLTAPGDRRFASLGLVRIDGWWRVGSVSACTSDFPGLEAAKVFGSGLPLVELVAVNEGHCWVETLEYGGREWDLRDEDQFGWGGMGPERFLRVGSVRLSSDGQRLDYVDLWGARLEFVPADTPGTEANQGGCA